MHTPLVMRSPSAFWPLLLCEALGAGCMQPPPGQGSTDSRPRPRDTDSTGHGESSQIVGVSGLDAHDGKLVQVGATYYLYGTRYGKGSSPPCENQPFHWGQQGTPWCGFGVWTTTDLKTWTYGGLLFSPTGVNSTLGNLNLTWQHTCSTDQGGNWSGCFNPRMVKRHDGTWLLWFNAPADNRAHSYYTMVCAGPAGPCGPAAEMPVLHKCLAKGDFDIADTADGVFLICTMNDQTFSTERLDSTWRNSAGDEGLHNLVGLVGVESPSIFGWGSELYLTYNDENCGYCNTNGTSWARSTSGMRGPWRVGGQLSPNSCAGQPRTVAWVNGEPWQWIDQWSPDQHPTQDQAAILFHRIRIESDRTLASFTCR